MVLSLTADGYELCLQGLIPWQAPPSNVNNLANGKKCTFNKFLDDTKFGGVVNTWRAGLPLTSITVCQKQTDKNLLNLNKDKYKVLHKGQSNSMQKHNLLMTRTWKHVLWYACQTKTLPKNSEKYAVLVILIDCCLQKLAKSGQYRQLQRIGKIDWKQYIKLMRDG